MSANDRQHGGDHYKNKAASDGRQHWDVVGDCFGPGYYVGCATKYAARWKDKNGLEDLLKADHFVDKLAEFIQSDEWFPRRPAAISAWLNTLEPREMEFCRLLFDEGNDLASLDKAKAILAELIKEAEAIPYSVPSATKRVVASLGRICYEDAVTVLINSVGHVLAAMSGGKPSVIQREGTNLAEAIKASALTKLMQDADKRREAKQKDD